MLYNRQIDSDYQLFSAYLYILSSNVKVALGLGILTKDTNLETFLDIIWMFIGLTIFGMCLGNIFRYLGNSVQDEQEYLNTVKFYQKICTENNID